MIRSNTFKIVKSFLNTIQKKFSSSRIPLFLDKQDPTYNRITILTAEQGKSIIPEHKIKQFQQSKSTYITNIQPQSKNQTTHYFYNENSWKKIAKISKNTNIAFSSKIKQSFNFVGIASQILTKGYLFSRKQKAQKQIKICLENIQNLQYVIQLAKSKIKAAQMADSRGNQTNTLQMLEQCKRIATQNPNINIKIIQGDQLLKQRFNLMHAVGRASKNPPIFVSLEYKGNPNSQYFYGIVGKGLCFDSGGLNLKPTSGISGMHTDKHGACSVISAFQGAVKLKLNLNIAAVVGLAQNFVASNSYRPLDIIKSRKGLTVQIGNTDAQGRLVLADCMNWIQQKYKLKTMVQLSTLTGAIIIALGKERAGLFTNSRNLARQLVKIGEQVEQRSWHLPIDIYHQQLIKAKQADITNSSGKSDGSSCQAAAFLKNFVQPGVKWAHIDVAGVTYNESKTTGYGAKLLIHYLSKQADKKHNEKQ